MGSGTGQYHRTNAAGPSGEREEREIEGGEGVTEGDRQTDRQTDRQRQRQRQRQKQRQRQTEGETKAETAKKEEERGRHSGPHTARLSVTWHVSENGTSTAEHSSPVLLPSARRPVSAARPRYVRSRPGRAGPGRTGRLLRATATVTVSGRVRPPSRRPWEHRPTPAALLQVQRAGREPGGTAALRTRPRRAGRTGSSG